MGLEKQSEFRVLCLPPSDITLSGTPEEMRDLLKALPEEIDKFGTPCREYPMSEAEWEDAKRSRMGTWKKTFRF
jgi:hypothetical protein